MIELVLTSYFISIKFLIKSTVNNDDNLIRNKNKYNIFSLDLPKDRDRKCSTWNFLDLEVLGIIILIFLVLALAYWSWKQI